MLKVHRQISRILIIVLLAAVCPGMAACRPSKVLRQIVYQQEAEIIDEEQEQLEPDDEGEKNEDFKNQQDETDTIRDEIQETGMYDPDGGMAPQGVVIEYDPNSNIDDVSSPEVTVVPTATPTPAAPSAEAPTPSPEPTQAPAAEPTQEPEPEQRPETQPTEEPTPEPTEEPTPPPVTPTVTPKASRMILDASGDYVEIPDDCRHVTAVGGAAQMVRMLGGSGRLFASDVATMTSAAAQTVMGDLSGVWLWWYDPNTEIDEGNGCFTALMNNYSLGELDACIVIQGTECFNSAELDAMAESGVPVVWLYPMNSIENMGRNADIIAQMMQSNDDTGAASEQIADSYKNWMTSLTNEVSNVTSGETYSIYIAGWDPGASYVIGRIPGWSHSAGSGLAYGYPYSNSRNLMSTWMRYAHVVNTTTVRNYSWDKYGNPVGDYVYVAPLLSILDATVTGGYSFIFDELYDAKDDPFISYRYSDTVYFQLGNDNNNFPAVIADSPETAAIVDSTYGSWFWQYHEWTEGEGGNIIDEDYRFYHAIGGPYATFVNPSGLGNWAEGGSVDSPLDAAWIACKFSGAYTMSDIYEKTRQFYSTFFNVSVGDDLLYSIYGE